MSYTINVTGHKDFKTVEEAITFEEKQLAAAQKLVTKFEGVTSAAFSGGHTGWVDLTKKEVP